VYAIAGTADIKANKAAWNKRDATLLAANNRVARRCVAGGGPCNFSLERLQYGIKLVS